MGSASWMRQPAQFCSSVGGASSSSGSSRRGCCRAARRVSGTPGRASCGRGCGLLGRRPALRRFPELAVALFLNWRRTGGLTPSAFPKKYWQGPADTGSWKYPPDDGFARVNGTVDKHPEKLDAGLAPRPLRGSCLGRRGCGLWNVFGLQQPGRLGAAALLWAGG